MRRPFHAWIGIWILLGHASSWAATDLEAADADAAAPNSARELLNMRDPFQRPAVKDNSKGIPRTELENFAVDQFLLVGVTTGPDRVKAMLRSPDGKTHFVTENMRIGMRNGVIRKITPVTILVREKLVNVMGQEETVDAEIRLPPESKRGTQ